MCIKLTRFIWDTVHCVFVSCVVPIKMQKKVTEVRVVSCIVNEVFK